MKRESDCSTTRLEEAEELETASFAWRILPRGRRRTPGRGRRDQALGVGAGLVKLAHVAENADRADHLASASRAPRHFRLVGIT